MTGLFDVNVFSSLITNYNDNYVMYDLVVTVNECFNYIVLYICTSTKYKMSYVRMKFQ